MKPCPRAPEPCPEIPIDVLPPIPREAREPATAPAPLADFGTFYHPASGVVILALDWLLFGTDLVTGFLALPEMCVLGFLATFVLVFRIQRRWSKDAAPRAFGKAFLGAFLVGLPMPITGTLLGAAILVLSGLPHHPVDVVRRFLARASVTR
ncbi:MAG: hypothetical protein WDO13_19755 [Verrucomicrobiota bacterium]